MGVVEVAILFHYRVIHVNSRFTKFVLLKTTGLICVWLSSCEQNSCQTKCDPFPDITKKFKRYQHEANDRQSATTKTREKSVTRSRESAPVRKQTKSSSSVKEISQQQPVEPTTAQNDDIEPEEQSDVPVCAGKISSLSLIGFHMKRFTV